MNLRKEVEQTLLPAALPIAMNIVTSSTSPWFGDSSVVLVADPLRVRIVRDKGQIFADFGSAAEPNYWFDSAVVFEYLGLSANASFHDEDVGASLRAIGGFVRTMGAELARLFAKESYDSRRHELDGVRKRQAEAQWGVKFP